MWDKIKNNFHYFVNFYFIACCLACALVTLLPWWPSTIFLVIPKYILLFAPRRLLFLALLVLLFLWNNLSKIQKYSLPLLFFISIKYLDFGMNFNPNNIVEEHKIVKIITANIGEGGQVKKIKLLLKYYQPDILLLQDANSISLKKIDIDYMFFECVGELCILSKHPFERTNQLSRALVGGWGNFAVFYKLYLGENTLNIANVHLQSVHSLLVDIQKGSVNFSDIVQLEDNKRIETGILSSWIKYEPYSLIVGDFNMPIEENIYQENFSMINNALSDVGIGFNDTIRIDGLSLRIDHILFSNQFDLIDAQVIESLGGDHLPVMVSLIIK
ncbi:endonuclease/exonuclease/phosphatase family protein [Colwellia psychrerythraea]|nr:endonuclease/exonuclease/phosphatase family protein [Colwellia psychrerythraea]